MLLRSPDNAGMHCLLSYHPLLKVPALHIPAKSIEGCALLIEAPWNRGLPHITRRCTLKTGVGHETGKFLFLLFHCISLDNIHSFSSFPSCLPLSLKFSSQKYVQVYLFSLCKIPVFRCLLQVSLRAAITTQTSRKTLTHCTCAETGFNVNEWKQWSGKTTEKPLAMQW